MRSAGGGRGSCDGRKVILILPGKRSDCYGGLLGSRDRGVVSVIRLYDYRFADPRSFRFFSAVQVGLGGVLGGFLVFLLGKE